MSKLKSFIIDDDLADASTRAMEVIVTLEDGSRRWCYFFTPEALSVCGDWVPGTRVLYHYGSYMIIVSEIDEEIVGKVLRALDQDGELIASTMAI